MRSSLSPDPIRRNPLRPGLLHLSLLRPRLCRTEDAIPELCGALSIPERRRVSRTTTARPS